MTKQVAAGVVERLPTYLECLLGLSQAGVRKVSSARLGELTGVNPAQIRRDLATFGSFGRRGQGYVVEDLVRHVQRILGSDHTHRMALVGAGNLGSAIAGYPALARHGFVVSAIFDKSPLRVGARVGDLVVQHVDDLARTVRRLGISVGIIAVPPGAAQEVADRLVDAGVRIILNYTPVSVAVPKTVRLHNTDPVKELLHTLYYLSARNTDIAAQHG